MVRGEGWSERCLRWLVRRWGHARQRCALLNILLCILISIQYRQAVNAVARDGTAHRATATTLLAWIVFPYDLERGMHCMRRAALAGTTDYLIQSQELSDLLHFQVRSIQPNLRTNGPFLSFPYVVPSLSW